MSITLETAIKKFETYLEVEKGYSINTLKNYLRDLSEFAKIPGEKSNITSIDTN